MLCLISYVLQLFNLPKKTIYCVDLENWFHYKEKREAKRCNFNVLEPRKVLEFKNNYLDIVSMFHVMHHMKESELIFRLKDINRILRKGGYLIIGEHDLLKVNDFCLADIEHGLFEVAIKKKPKYFYENHFTRYYNWINLDILLQQLNFKIVKWSNFNADAQGNYLPTRSWIAVYKKNK